MIFNVSGGGGTALNFDVKAYATEALLLAATPKANTIGIITEVPITSWIFSATEPSLEEAGRVWISVGESSPVEFNALRKNGIQVYPLAAKQYVGGAWVDKTAMIYQGGAWNQMITELTLYELGVRNAGYAFTDSSTGNGKVTYNSDHILLTSVNGNNGIPVLYIENVNLSAFNRIELEYSDYSPTSATSDAFVLRILDGSTNVAESRAETTGSGKITVNLSGVSDTKRIRVHYYVASTTAKTVKIKKIKMYA